MAGVLPGQGRRAEGLVRFGYATLTARQDSLLFRQGEQVPVRVATYGGRFTNLVKRPEDQVQMLVTSGSWLAEDTFQIVCRWTQTCFTKKLNFRFTQEGFTVEAVSNSPFPEPQAAISAKLI